MTGTGRRSTAPSLPGGADLQIVRIGEYLDWVANGTSYGWLSDEQVQADALVQLRGTGLLVAGSRPVRLTTEGAQWLATRDPAELFRALHANILYFGEMLSLLIERERRVEELLDEANTRFQLGWRSADQVRRRLALLTQLSLVEEAGERRHRGTPAGIAALATVELQDAVSAAPRELELELPAMPDEIHEHLELARADPGRRVAAIGYFPQDRLAFISYVLRVASNGADLGELTSDAAERFSIAASSARSALNTVKQLGLIGYTGRTEVTTTPLGHAWLEVPSALNFIRIAHARYQCVGEVIPLLASVDSSASVHRRLTFAGERVPHQSRTATVIRWFIEAGGVEEIGSRYRATAFGRLISDELPLSQMSGQPSDSGAQVPVLPEENEFHSLARELVEASTDSAEPGRFEAAAAQAFQLLGLHAKRVGGPGSTDVVVEVRAGFELLARVVVDTKSAASGEVQESAVSFNSISDHAKKHSADYKLVVGPSFGGRLAKWASEQGIALLTAEDLAEMLLKHRETPWSPGELVNLFAGGARAEIEAAYETSERQRSLVAAVLEELVLETGEGGESITPRDIYRALRKQAGLSPTEGEIREVLEFLAAPIVGAVREDRGSFALVESPSTTGLRLRGLARVFDSRGR
ncbi:restriction endonuclease [Agromyces mediolanus]|uniref:Restriction endonuclease type IV Mrr domain-containing protein n=1 Tax=Agromyces mediolanus TaxID=41986 RepID=A0A918CM74_AGRME|nr:restriction endonuclease [Agromyces mediolanus]GGR31052.1 hypothetical protein GCM10010196_26510 [Agromyces mediolanus]GLJ72447.1 hypothetical protein GCM10017583_17030 [Agromyces mediolanus]